MTLQAAAIWHQPWKAPPVLGGAISHDAGRITALRETASTGDKIVCPGLINAHDHGRGLRPLSFGAADGPLEAWLWDLHRAPSSDVYLTSLVAFAQMALSGVTTVLHNHLPQSDDLVAEAKAVAKAAREVGIRLGFVVPVLDQNLAGYDGGAAVREALDPTDWKHIEQTQRQRPADEQIAIVGEIAKAIDDAEIMTQYGPPGPQWLSAEGLAAVGRAADADGRRIHVHLLETQLQRSWMDACSRDGAAAFFEQFGLLNDRLTVAHGVFLRPHEIAAFADAGAMLALNTSSNLRLTSGIADGEALAASGLRLGIGLDGMALDDDADILREVRLTSMMLGPKRFEKPGIPQSSILKAAFSGGRFGFDGREGAGIQVGADADFITLSQDAIAGDQLDPSPETLAQLIVGRAARANVCDVFVGGRQIVADGKLTGIDLDEAQRELIGAARKGFNPPAWIGKARAARVAASKKQGSS